MNDFGVLGPIMGVVGVLYLIPSFTAVVRQRPDMATIFGVNFLLGWTIVGWIVALMWALRGRERQDRRYSRSGRKPCPECGHSLRKTSRRCRHCGYTFETAD